MIIDIDWEQDAFTGTQGNAPKVAGHKRAVIPEAKAEAEAAHWAKNILLWSSYLPYDCVESMVRMGWHRST